MGIERSAVIVDSAALTLFTKPDFRFSERPTLTIEAPLDWLLVR